MVNKKDAELTANIVGEIKGMNMTERHMLRTAKII
jgi:hypothetical protein